MFSVLFLETSLTDENAPNEMAGSDVRPKGARTPVGRSNPSFPNSRNKHNKGRKFPQQWVFGGIERGSKKVFLVKVEKRDRDTLMALIKKHIKIGTHIISDTHRAYNKIKDIPGYTHSTVNHRKHFVDEEDPNVHIQNMEAT